MDEDIPKVQFHSRNRMKMSLLMNYSVCVKLSSTLETCVSLLFKGEVLIINYNVDKSSSYDFQHT